MALGLRKCSFILYGDLYSTPSRLLLRSAPDPCTAKKKSFETRVECVRKNPGEQSLRQRKPIPHSGANHQECMGLGCGGTSKRNKVTSVPMSRVNCDLWCPGWESKDLGGRPEQDPGYTSRPWHQYGIRSAAGGAASGVHKACRQIRFHVIKYQSNIALKLIT